jgi:hypothetical protein
MGADYLGAMENCRFPISFLDGQWRDTDSFCNRIGFMLFKDGPLCPKFCIHLGGCMYEISYLSGLIYVQNFVEYPRGLMYGVLTFYLLGASEMEHPHLQAFCFPKCLVGFYSL